MIFTEGRFALFFALAFVVAWSLRRGGARKFWLLICSYAFYAAWDWRFLSLLVLSTAVDFVVGGALGRSSSQRHRRWLLATSLTVNLGCLCIFKYLDFFVESAAAFTAWLGLPIPVTSLSIVLPMGISFYTFQTLSYSIDVYGRKMEPTRSLLDFALFVAFFPQLVAGPIIRARDFLPQLAKVPRFADVAVRSHLLLFGLGYIKKACVADHIAGAIDPLYKDPGAWDAASNWLASFLYSLQIYCDFSGYSDMAIACAGLLGYRLTLNFDFPYLARSIQVFWRRWHISLSTWFRDYLYIPLGGNRVSRIRVATNLITVFLLCGLWHGASWNFVLWGAYHGAFLSFERRVNVDRLPRFAGWLYMGLVVNFGFVLFRCVDLSTTGAMVGRMLGLGGSAGDGRIPAAWWLLLPTFFLVHAWLRRRSLDERLERLPAWGFALAYGAAAALVFPWAAVGYTPFIYFQF